jgi:integrase
MVNERFDKFINFYKTKQIKTLERYIYILSKIPESVFTSIRTKEDLSKLQTFFINSESSGGFSFMKNYKIVYYAIKLYLNFQNKKEIATYLDKNLMPKGKKTVTFKHLEPDVINRIIDNAKYTLAYKKQLDNYTRTYKDKWAIVLKPKQEADRDTLFIKFLWRTGTRCSEALAVKFIDINLEKKLIKILGKGGKTREALITQELIDELKIFCRENNIDEYSLMFNFLNTASRTEKMNHDMELFGDKKGKKIYMDIRKLGLAESMIKKVGKFCEQNKIITPHQVRHSLAYLLHHNNVPLDRIQQVLGHSNIATTQIYAQTTIEDVREDYNRIQNGLS